MSQAKTLSPNEGNVFKNFDCTPTKTATGYYQNPFSQKNLSPGKSPQSANSWSLLKERNQSLESENAAMQDQIQKWEAKQAEFDETKRSLEELKRTYDNLAAEHDALKRINAELTDKKLVEKRQFEEAHQLQKEYETANSVLREKLVELEGMQEAQKKELEEIAALKNQILQENASLKQKNEQQAIQLQEQSEYTQSQCKRITESQQSFEALKKTHDDLAAELTTLKEPNAVLEGNLAEKHQLETTNQNLEHELTQQTQTNTQLRLQLDNQSKEIKRLTHEELVSSIVAGSATAEKISDANLAVNQVLDILQALGQAPQGQSLIGELLTLRKRQTILVVTNSIQKFKLDDVLAFKALIDAKKGENIVSNAYSFIRQEQGFFRSRYGNTKTWETIMGLVKTKLKNCLETAKVDQLAVEQKSKAMAIFQTHRQHGYGFGFFSTPKIPPSVENKLAATQVPPNNLTLLT